MNRSTTHLEQLIARCPALSGIRPAMAACIDLVIDVFESGNTLYVCGNGGSGADADHIVGEFLKGFALRRPLPAAEQDAFRERYGEEGARLADKLQQGLRCISLLSHPGLLSAFGNDVDPLLGYAQQLHSLGRPGDAVLGISASGNAENIRQTFMTAQVMKVKTVLLTGTLPGKCTAYADLVIPVPETETYRIQELHLPFYHTMCLAVEAHFFGQTEPSR